MFKHEWISVTSNRGQHAHTLYGRGGHEDRNKEGKVRREQITGKTKIMGSACFYSISCKFSHF